MSEEHGASPWRDDHLGEDVRTYTRWMYVLGENEIVNFLREFSFPVCRRYIWRTGKLKWVLRHLGCACG